MVRAKERRAVHRGEGNLNSGPGRRENDVVSPEPLHHSPDRDKGSREDNRDCSEEHKPDPRDEVDEASAGDKVNKISTRDTIPAEEPCKMIQMSTMQPQKHQLRQH